MNHESAAVDRALRAIATRPDSRLLVTGATGFVGSAVLALLDACAQSGSSWQTTCVSRRGPSSRLRAETENLAPEWVALDVTERFDDLGPFDLVLHAATPTDARTHEQHPFEIVDAIVGGTRNLVWWAQAQRRPPAIVHTSSGAVYGPQPVGAASIPEDAVLAPDPASAASGYAEAKRFAETLLAISAGAGILSVVNARLFAFVGPHQPHDGHFAITSFVRDALAGGPVVVNGSGEVVRSYLYEEDMAGWLVAALALGSSPTALHIGSDRGMRLVDVAHTVGRIAGCDVDVLGKPGSDGPRGAYVPQTALSRLALDVDEWTTLDEAIGRLLEARRSHV